MNSPIASTSPGVLKASCRTDWSSSGKLDARNSNHDAASSSQGWRKDALQDGCTGKPVATEENQEHQNYPEDFVGTGTLVAPGYQGYPGTPGTPGDSGDSEAEGYDKDWPHHLHITQNNVHHMARVFSIVRQAYYRSSTDSMKDLDVNTAIWSIFMSVTLQAAVHLGKDYTENLRSTKNQPKKSLRQLFQVTERFYMFKDTEAVIKMIITGRSPTMRHLSRTHRVAREWLFDRINLDPKIQIKYIDTKHQLADTLTKGNVTRDGWDNLLHLFNISHYSFLCCAQSFRLICCPKTMAKRMQERKEEDRIVSKSKPMAMNLASTVSTSSSSVNHPIA